MEHDTQVIKALERTQLGHDTYQVGMEEGNMGFGILHFDTPARLAYTCRVIGGLETTTGQV